MPTSPKAHRQKKRNRPKPEGPRRPWYQRRGQASEPISKKGDDKSDDPSHQEATGIPHPKVWQRSTDTAVIVRGVSLGRKANGRMNARNARKVWLV